MSVDASSWSWASRTGKPQLKLLLLKLADHADPSGICWPSQKRLATDCECSVRAIRDNLERLENAKLILRVPAFRDDGSRTSDVYVLAPEGDRAPMAKVDREHEKWPQIEEAWRAARGDDPPAEPAGDPPAEPAAPPAPVPAGPPGMQLPGVEPSVEPSENTSSLGARATAVMTVLEKIAAEKPCQRPKLESVAAALDAFPEVDAAVVAGELEFWTLHGNGKAKQVKNLASTFRNFLKRADQDRRAKPPESSVQFGGRTDVPDYDKHVRYD